MKKIQLKLIGMHCTSCSVLIDTVLEELPGVKKAKTNYAAAIVEVEFETSKVNPDQMIAAIVSEGYQAQMN